MVQICGKSQTFWQNPAPCVRVCPVFEPILMTDGLSPEMVPDRLI